jgi:hypothetical protein
MLGGTEEDRTIQAAQLVSHHLLPAPLRSDCYSSVAFFDNPLVGQCFCAGGAYSAKCTRDFAVTVMIKITAESHNGRVLDNRLAVKQKPYSSPSFHPRKPPPN